jgi:hypothetical protein
MSTRLIVDELIIYNLWTQKESGHIGKTGCVIPVIFEERNEATKTGLTEAPFRLPLAVGLLPNR